MKVTAMHSSSLIGSGLLVASLLAGQQTSVDRPAEKVHDEVAMRAACDRLFAALDSVRVARDYPKAIEQLLSVEPDKQINGLKVLAATGEPAVIPWLVSMLDADEHGVALHAGLGLSEIVSAHELRRRDLAAADKVVLKPRGADDLDLRPLAWVVRRMLKMPDDGNVHGYAATLIRYLELGEFAPELRRLLVSKHPAVSNKARWALESLDCAVDSDR